MDGLSIRVVASDEYDRVAPLVELFDGAKTTGDMLRQREARDPGAIGRYFLAEVDGSAVGFARGFRRSDHEPGWMWVAVYVLSDHRGGGIGSGLYRAVLEFISRHNASILETKIREDSPRDIEISGHYGYLRYRHDFESVLTISDYVEPAFDQFEADGIVFRSLADAGESEEFQRQLHEINVETGRDVPGSHATAEWTFEQFQCDVIRAHWSRPEGQILAVRGSEPIGLAAIGEFSPGVFYNTMTGVRRDFRGRGLAFTLKVLATRAAIGLGAWEIITNNDSTNMSMLALNERLGYVRRPGWYRYRHKL